VTCGSSVRQAACVYSLIRPPRTGFGGSVVYRRRSRWRGERHIRRRGRVGRCPGAAGPCCSAPGTRSGRHANVARRVSHPVEELAAQGTKKAFADRVHARSLDSAAQDRSASCLEDGVEGACEVRASVADQESDVLEPLVEAEGEVAGQLHGPLTGGVRGDAADVYGRCWSFQSTMGCPDQRGGGFTEHTGCECGWP
jgi:hypothetical protein